MNTINISLPESLYKEARRVVRNKGYSSISELVRDGLRKVIYPQLTENGFTPEFEEAVLRSAQEPVERGIMLETDEDVKKYFKHLKYPKTYKTSK